MAVKILIKRKVPEGKNEDLSRLLMHMRALTMIQPGYISGETLQRVDRPGESLVISTWQSVEAWNAWFQGRERLETQEKIDNLTGIASTYEIYEYP